MAQTITTFKDIFQKYKKIFKNKIRSEYREDLFEKDKEHRIELKTEHTVHGGEPEPLTESIIKEMLRECEINPLDITHQYVLKGEVLSKIVDSIERKQKTAIISKIKKPDLFIKSANSEDRDLLFEIEHLNKPLDIKGDMEGIEQALSWYNLDRMLISECNSIVTNFFEWILIKYNKDNRKFDYIKFTPEEALEYIKNIKLGRGRLYVADEDEEQKQHITSEFYYKFQERLKQLLDEPSRIKTEINVINYKKTSDILDDDYERNLINYYRKIFTRLIFIKIIESWKRIEIDPLYKLFKQPKRHWPTELKLLFFEVFNKKPENRSKDIIEEFKSLPYLNGGLFRPTGIEIDEYGNLTNVHLNPDGIKDIWDFLGEYKFTRENDVSEEETEEGTIKPEILGYILERTIGDQRKKTGTYYTPEKVTDYIVSNTLIPYIIEKINSHFSDTLSISKITDIDNHSKKVEIYHYLATEILPLIRICDPACGSGAFLEKTADTLLYLYEKCYAGCGRVLKYRLPEALEPDSQMPFKDKHTIKKYILQHNIYGVDISLNAIEICELRLWLWAIKLPNELIGSTEYVDLPALPNIEYNIRVGNSLIGYHQGERISKIGKEDFRRLDEQFFSTHGSAIKDIINKKQSQIECYYQKDEQIGERKKEKVRREIDNIVDSLNNELNNLLKEDFGNKGIEVEMIPIRLSRFHNSPDMKKKIQDLIRKTNIENDLSYFKVNFKKPVEIDYQQIRDTPGVTCYVKKNDKVTSIYPTASFNFKYYSEYDEKPFSKFIYKLIPNWNDVDNIEFKKYLNVNDLNLLDPFHWVMEFPEIFFHNNESSGFDIIIGNPPFIRADTEDKFFLLQRNLLEELKNYKTIWEKWDIYIAFIERSLRDLIKGKGKFGFVSSDALCTVKYARKMRNWLKENKAIIQIDYFEDFEVFKGIGINPILLFVNNNENKGRVRKIIHKGNFDTISKNYEMDQDSKYLWKKNNPEILNYKFNNYELLGNICYISYGLRPNADEKTAKGAFSKNDLISEKKTEINTKKYVEGKNIQRYKVNEINYLEWDTERCPSKIARETFKELYLDEKIIYGTFVEGLFDLNELICNHSLIVFKKFIDLIGIENQSINNSLSKYNKNFSRNELERISKNFTYEYLLAIMNSKLANTFLNAIRRHKLENYFYPADFRKLPIIRLKDQTIFIKLVNILQFLYQSDKLKDIRQYLDDIILNFLIYELYFKDSLKEENLYQDLLNSIGPKLVKVNFKEWVQLKFKTDKTEQELERKKQLEEKKLKKIKQGYKEINVPEINDKISKMQKSHWIDIIENY